jgi:hypothetical protein
MHLAGQGFASSQLSCPHSFDPLSDYSSQGNFMLYATFLRSVGTSRVKRPQAKATRAIVMV